MDKGFQDRWREGALEVWLHANRDRSGYAPAVKGGFNTTLSMLFRKLEHLSDDWTDAQQEMLVARVLPRSYGDTPHARGLFRALRLGFVTAGGRGLEPSRGESLVLAELGRSATPRPAPMRPVGAGRHFDVTFAFAYGGRIAGRRGVRTMAGLGRATVERIDARDVEERVALVTEDGVPVDCARVDGVWFRTVCAPDGSGPLREEAFAGACSGTEPWADDPFADNLAVDRQGQAPALSVLERTLRCDDAAPDGDAAASSERACLAHAGRIASLDGVVMVRTEAPIWTMARIGHNEASGPLIGSRTCHLAWRMGRLTSTSHLGPLPRLGLEPVDWSGGCRRGEVYPTFPHDARGLAEVFARDVAKASGSRFVMPPIGTADPTPDALSVIRDVIAAAPLPEPSAIGGHEIVGCLRDDLLATLGSGSAMAVADVTRRVKTGIGYNYKDARFTMRALGKVATQVLEGRHAPEHDDEEVSRLVM